MPNYNNSYSNLPYYGGFRSSDYMGGQNGQQFVSKGYMENNGSDNYLKGKPVTSIEEGRAQSVELDGSIFYFPDISNKRIYTKQFNPDGTVSFKIYVEDQSGESSLKYVTQQELVDAVAGIKTMINNYILALAPVPVSQAVGTGFDNNILNANKPNNSQTAQPPQQNNSDMTFNI